jgi:uncharacterized protein (UPF0147 family)
MPEMRADLSAVFKLLDHIFTQPTLSKAVGLTDEMSDKILSNNQQSFKVKKAMELISTVDEILS